VAEVAAAGEDHRQVMAVGHLDGHLVADRPARLDDGRDPGLGRELDAVREREVAWERVETVERVREADTS